MSATDRISFDGQVVVVTGAGQGIGRAHALEFASRGGAVVVNDFARDHSDAVVAEIVAAGGNATASYDSVSTAEGGAAIIDTAIRHFGTVDVLVNNAGFLRTGYFEDLSFEQIDAVLDVHLSASFFVTQPAWRVMKAKEYGRIIMTGSSSGMFSHHGLSNYAAAKAGVYGLTKALAYEGAAYGISCNVILPYAQTSINAKDPIPDFEVHLGKYVSEKAITHWASNSTPDQISHLAAYLASTECAVSGEAFSICAGRYARVFVGIADGWLADDVSRLSAENIRDHFEQIRDVSRHTVPKWLFEEIGDVAARSIARNAPSSTPSTSVIGDV